MGYKLNVIHSAYLIFIYICLIKKLNKKIEYKSKIKMKFMESGKNKVYNISR
jgi:hypothetical protein